MFNWVKNNELYFLLLLYNRNAAELMIPCCGVDAYLPMNHRRKSLERCGSSFISHRLLITNSSFSSFFKKTIVGCF